MDFHTQTKAIVSVNQELAWQLLWKRVVQPKQFDLMINESIIQQASQNQVIQTTKIGGSCFIQKVTKLPRKKEIIYENLDGSIITGKTYNRVEVIQEKVTIIMQSNALDSLGKNFPTKGWQTLQMNNFLKIAHENH